MSGESTGDRFRSSEVIQAVTRALVGATNREELDQGVCEAIVSFDPYTLAWVGEHDAATDAVVPTTATGAVDDALEGSSIAVRAAPSKDGPTATAVRTGSIQVRQELGDHPEHELWHQEAPRGGFQASAAIPVGGDDHQHGVLTVYADRPEAFDEAETALLAELGETIAAGIAGIEARAERQPRVQESTRRTHRSSDARPDENALSIVPQEIAERNERERERELERTRDFLEQTQEVLSVGGWEVDLRSESLHWTDEVYRIHDLPLEFEPTIEEALDHYHPEDRPVVEGAFDRLRTEGEPYDLELRLVTPADEVRWVRTVGIPQHGEDDEVVGIRGVFQDITDRKEREQELERTTTTLEAIIEASPDPIVMLDEELRVTRWNQGAERVFGWSRDEILGERAPFVPEDKKVELDHLVENLDRGKQNRFVDTVRQQRNGDRIEVGLSSAKVEAGDTFTGYLGVFKDIRQQKKHERQIEALHDATRQLIELESKQEAATAIAEAASDLLDFPAPSVWYPSDGGTALELVASSEHHQELLEGAGTTSPRHARGDWLWNIFEDGETVVQDAVPPGDGATDGLLTSAIIVPLGEHGLLSCATASETAFNDQEILLATIFGQNVTAVLDSLDRELTVREQRDNLEVLDQMVRHDIRNDLQVVSGYAETLEQRVDEADREYVEVILDSATAARELTQTARELAETMLQADTETEPMPLKQTLESQLEEVRAASGTASVTVEGRVPDIQVAADGMLRSVFRNLLKNAVQHNDKDVPEVSVTVRETDPQVAVQIADNGPGIPDDQKTGIFEKKQKGGESTGTGIGLYLVTTLVEGYGGTVHIEDNEPEGSVFTVELPRVERD